LLTYGKYIWLRSILRKRGNTRWCNGISFLMKVSNFCPNLYIYYHIRYLSSCGEICYVICWLLRNIAWIFLNYCWIIII
jgi:hypothetical protein